MTSTIITKNSSTASGVPLAADLTAGELAINLADKRLFSKNGSTVFEVGTTPSTVAVAGNATVGGTLGVTGATTLAATSATTLSASSTVTLSGGTANGVAYLNGSKVLTTGSALTFDGTYLTLGAGTSVENYIAVNALTYSWQRFKVGGADRGYIGTANSFISGGAGTDFAVSGINNLVFGIGSTEQMRLTSTGLGIGTSSIVQQLTIGGTGNMYATGGATWYTGGDLYIRAGTSGKLRLGANNANDLAILDTSGNLGLGVTPSAWSGGKAMQIGATYSLALSGFGDDSSITTNAYYNNAGNWVYQNTASTYKAARYNQFLGSHIWSTAAATGAPGSTITWNQAMTLDASGNLGIGTSSPAYKLDVQASGYPAINIASTSVSGSNGSYFQAKNGGAAVSFFGTETTAGGYSYTGAIANSAYIGSAAANPLQFVTNSIARATIDSSGNLLVGTTSTINLAKMVMSFTNASNGFYLDEISNSSGTQYVRFSQSGTTTGSITRVAQTSAVTYNTTSDYRLKNVVGDVTGSGERIDALEPIEYEWKADGTRTRGFLAHKFQEVYPHSVTGDKDAVDADGNPLYQAMQASSSEVIADLVAEIQSLRKRLAAAGIA